jgi:hypothetical protein
MENSRQYWVDPSLLEPMRLLGFDGFNAWMHSKAGEVVSRCGTGEVLRINIGGEIFFLKRRHSESRLAMMGLLLHISRPMGGAIREARMLDQLASCGFPVMRAAAFGEKCEWGLPVESFLLTRAVAGESGRTFFQNSGQAARCDFMRQIGLLTGKLHSAGFFDPVRPKDLIVGADGQMTLIDRESRHPWPKRFSRHRAVCAIARTAERTLRKGVRFGPATVRCYLAGYRKGVGSKWETSLDRLVKTVFRQIRRELGAKFGSRSRPSRSTESP